jgi:predicted GNAT family N-acyltransferase
LLEIRDITVDSIEYQQEKQLRNQILRFPLGLSLSDADTSQDDNNYHFAVFNPAGELIACVLLQPLNNTTVQLRQMAVRNDAQKQGVGRRLVKYAEARASAYQYKIIELSARLTAQVFYEQCGYKTTGAIFEHINIPHIKMRKILESS